MKVRNLLAMFLLPLALQAQGPLRLDSCKQMALQHNKAIQKARTNVAVARALRKTARTYFLPGISANGNYTHFGNEFQLLTQDLFLPVVPAEAQGNINNDAFWQMNPELAQETFASFEQVQLPDGSFTMVPTTDENGNPIFDKYTYLPKDELAVSAQDVYTGGILLQQTLYAGGKVRQTFEAARLSESLALQQQQMKMADVLVEVEESYWRVLAIKEKVVMAKEYQAMLDTLVNDLENYQQEGLITHNELLKARIKRNDVALQLTQAQNGLHISYMALNQLIGLPLDSLPVLEEPLKMPTRQTPDAQTLLQSALSERPEIRALETQVELSETGVKLMRARMLPNVSLQAGYLWMNPNPYQGFEQEFGGDWNVGVGVNIPIFRWGNRLHTMKAAEWKKQEALLELDEAREKIHLQVRKTRFELEELQKQVALTELSQQQANENLRIVQDNFNEGMAKTADLLEAQALWQKAKARHIDALTQLRLKHAQLKQVAGQILEDYIEQQPLQNSFWDDWF